MKTITTKTVFEVEDEYSRCSDSELIDAINRILNAYFYHDTWIIVGETEIVEQEKDNICEYCKSAVEDDCDSCVRKEQG